MSSKQDFEEVISKIDPNISWDILNIYEKVYVLQQAWNEVFPNLSFNPYKTVSCKQLGYEEVTPPASIQDDILYINFLFNEVTEHLYLWNEENWDQGLTTFNKVSQTQDMKLSQKAKIMGVKHSGATARLGSDGYTSQECSECGYTDKLNRENQADFLCKKCGHTMNADLNAAINILGRY